MKGVQLTACFSLKQFKLNWIGGGVFPHEPSWAHSSLLSWEFGAQVLVKNLQVQIFNTNFFFRGPIDLKIVAVDWREFCYWDPCPEYHHKISQFPAPL